jgi:hypothetical protein
LTPLSTPTNATSVAFIEVNANQSTMTMRGALGRAPERGACKK